jgi:hypothetical protein
VKPCLYPKEAWQREEEPAWLMDLAQGEEGEAPIVLPHHHHEQLVGVEEHHPRLPSPVAGER